MSKEDLTLDVKMPQNKSMEEGPKGPEFLDGKGKGGKPQNSGGDIIDDNEINEVAEVLSEEERKEQIRNEILAGRDALSLPQDEREAIEALVDSKYEQENGEEATSATYTEAQYEEFKKLGSTNRALTPAFVARALGISEEAAADLIKRKQDEDEQARLEAQQKEDELRRAAEERAERARLAEEQRKKEEDEKREVAGEIAETIDNEVERREEEVEREVTETTARLHAAGISQASIDSAVKEIRERRTATLTPLEDVIAEATGMTEEEIDQEIEEYAERLNALYINQEDSASIFPESKEKEISGIISETGNIGEAMERISEKLTEQEFEDYVTKVTANIISVVFLETQDREIANGLLNKYAEKLKGIAENGVDQKKDDYKNIFLEFEEEVAEIRRNNRPPEKPEEPEDISELTAIDRIRDGILNGSINAANPAAAVWGGQEVKVIMYVGKKHGKDHARIQMPSGQQLEVPLDDIRAQTPAERQSGQPENVTGDFGNTQEPPPTQSGGGGGGEPPRRNAATAGGAERSDRSNDGNLGAVPFNKDFSQMHGFVNEDRLRDFIEARLQAFKAQFGREPTDEEREALQPTPEERARLEQAQAEADAKNHRYLRLQQKKILPAIGQIYASNPALADEKIARYLEIVSNPNTAQMKEELREFMADIKKIQDERRRQIEKAKNPNNAMKTELSDIAKELLELDLGDDEKYNHFIETLKSPSSDILPMIHGFFERYEVETQLLNFQSILADPDRNRARDRLLIFIRTLENKLVDARKDLENIDSAQALFKFIAATQSQELYGPGGKYPLIEIDENGIEHIRKDNFMIWVRQQTVKLHGDNPNSEMNPLSAVGLETRVRNFNIYMLSLFRQRYFRDANTGEILDDLADQALNEAYTFGSWRNGGLAYGQVMTNDSELPKLIGGQLHIKNDATRGTNMEDAFSIPSEFGKEHDTKVGDSIMHANDIYYNFSDPAELRKILGEGVFTRQDFIDAILILQKKYVGRDENPARKLDNYSGHFDGDYDLNGNPMFYVTEKLTNGGTKKHLLFDEQGNLRIDTFVERMNFFISPTSPLSTIELVRELVRTKMSQKFGLENGLYLTAEEQQEYDAKTDSSEKEKYFKMKRAEKRINLEYAELYSWIEQRIFGAAGRNDTFRRGHDAITKLYLADYLLRQSREGTMGPVGVPDAMLVFGALANDFWAGLITESGKTPLEIFGEIRVLNGLEGINDEERAMRRKEIMSQLKFTENAEYDYATNAIVRAFNVFEMKTGGKQLDLNKIVTHTYWGGIKYEPAEFEKQVKDDFIKNLRYMIASNAGNKYGQKVRYWDGASNNGRGEWVDGYNADKMFCKDITDGFEEWFKEIYKERQNSPDESWNLFMADKNGKTTEELTYSYMDTSAGRTRLVKLAARTELAMHMKFHRRRTSTGETWGYSRTQTFLHALETLQEWERDPNNPGRVRVKKGATFFTHEDIEWMRKAAGAEEWRLMLQDTLRHGVLEGMGKGFLDAIKIFMGSVAGAK